MELWIRSQDKKKLCKATNLYIKTSTTYSNYGSYEQIAIFNDNIWLGDYKEERALEILDEIESLLKPKVLLNSGKIIGSFENTIYKEPDKTEIQKLSIAVYEMPEE